MKRSFPWVEGQVDASSYLPSSSSNPSSTTHFHSPLTTHITSQDVVTRRAEMYQEHMKQIAIPTQRGSVIPFNSWMGLGRSIKQLYGQPLHYLTNILLNQWDQMRIGTGDEYTPLDNIIHPCKAEATIWLLEEVHRQTSSHVKIAQLWKEDPMYNAFVDSIFPTLEHTS